VSDYDLQERAQFAAVDPERLFEGRPLPVLTTLIYDICNNDPDKFEHACKLIRIIQDRTIDLIRKEGLPE
jgi:hypothetical protein